MLTLDANMSDPDDFYETLVAAHAGLSEAESAAFNARLILILANQIGDPDVLKAAIEIASNRA